MQLDGVALLGVRSEGRVSFPVLPPSPLHESEVHYPAKTHHDTDETRTYLGHHHRDKLVVIDHTVT
jgi:hypothetical protein